MADARVSARIVRLGVVEPSVAERSVWGGSFEAIDRSRRPPERPSGRDRSRPAHRPSRDPHPSGRTPWWTDAAGATGLRPRAGRRHADRRRRVPALEARRVRQGDRRRATNSTPGIARQQALDARAHPKVVRRAAPIIYSPRSCAPAANSIRTRSGRPWYRLPSPLRNVLARNPGDPLAIDDQRPAAGRPLDGGSIDSGPRFRLLVERSPDVFYRVRLTPEPVLEYVSPAAETVTGYSPAELLDDPTLWQELVHPDDRALIPTARPWPRRRRTSSRPPSS